MVQLRTKKIILGLFCLCYLAGGLLFFNSDQEPQEIFNPDINNVMGQSDGVENYMRAMQKINSDPELQRLRQATISVEAPSG